jgi:NitT/TauT family transport system substrate-binding protein
MSRLRTRSVALLAALAAVVAAGCSRAESAPGTPEPAAGGTAAELRLGYFPNVTHAAAIIGDREGLFTAELGDTRLTTQQFNAGGDAVNALFGGSLDATYIGSGPSINAFAQSDGEAVRLVAGATDGGAQLVVRPDITSAEQLRGTTIATPQLGNTQDIALKVWLAEEGLTIGEGPDQVQIANLENPRTLDAFRVGDVDAAWLPEPWSSRLVLDAGASVLLDEREIWPDGSFPTTVLIVATDFLRQYPDTVRALLRGHIAATGIATDEPERARTIVNDGIEELTGNRLADAVIERAFGELRLSVDPLASTWPQLAQDSVDAGIADELVDLTGFIDVDPLNAELTAAGQQPVDAAGLDDNS